MFDQLSKQLDFPFKRNGALVVCFEEENLPKLYDLYTKGITNGVQDLHILNASQVKELSPNLSDEVKGALYAKTSGIVGPYEMTIAFAENACDNGAKFVFNSKVNNIQKIEDKWLVSCENGQSFDCDIVINCGGVYADEINNMVNMPSFEIVARKGEYELLDKTQGYLTQHTIFQLPTKMGKGILVTPTCHGNTLIGPTADDIDDKTNVANTISGLNTAFTLGQKSIPSLNKRFIIKQFSGLRAHSSNDDFIIEWANDSFFNVGGIASPGLTAAPAIGQYVAQEISTQLNLTKNSNFNPIRKGIPCFATMSDTERQQIIAKNPLYGNIVCKCELVTEGEIVDSITRTLGATDLDGIKRRTRYSMGKCQGGFCTAPAMELLAKHTNLKMTDIDLCGTNSKVLVGRVKQ